VFFHGVGIGTGFVGPVKQGNFEDGCAQQAKESSFSFATFPIFSHVFYKHAIHFSSNLSGLQLTLKPIPTSHPQLSHHIVVGLKTTSSIKSIKPGRQQLLPVTGCIAIFQTRLFPAFSWVIFPILKGFLERKKKKNGRNRFIEKHFRPTFEPTLGACHIFSANNTVKIKLADFPRVYKHIQGLFKGNSHSTLFFYFF